MSQRRCKIAWNVVIGDKTALSIEHRSLNLREADCPTGPRGSTAMRALRGARGRYSTTRVDREKADCRSGAVPQTSDFQTEFDQLRRVKAVSTEAAALSHWVTAQDFHRQTQVMMRALITQGFSQAEIARELGVVSRQAVQKMLTL